MPVIEMLTGATLLSDGAGGFNGAVMREAKAAACEPSKALEIWSKNADKGVCNVAGTVANLWIHWVLPRTINWEISGGLNFTNGALEVVLKGYAETFGLAGVKVIGVNVDAIHRGEDRIAFKETMTRLGIDMPASQAVTSVEDAERVAALRQRQHQLAQKLKDLLRALSRNRP